MVARIAGMAMLVIAPAIAVAAEPAKETYCNGRPKVFKNVRMYPNGRPIQTGEVFLFPNGRPTTHEDGTFLYANGRRMVEKGLSFYPNGRIMVGGGASYYPNRRVLSHNGIFYDHHGHPTQEVVKEVSIRWDDFKYDFDVVDRVPSQTRIRISNLDKGVMLSFVLEKGEILDVNAACDPSGSATARP